MYISEIVEEACQAREAGQEEDPLQPNHIREAVRRLRKRDKVPKSRYKKVLQTYTQLIYGHQAEAVLFRHQHIILSFSQEYYRCT